MTPMSCSQRSAARSWVTPSCCIAALPAICSCHASTPTSKTSASPQRTAVKASGDNSSRRVSRGRGSGAPPAWNWTAGRQTRRRLLSTHLSACTSHVATLRWTSEADTDSRSGRAMDSSERRLSLGAAEIEVEVVAAFDQLSQPLGESRGGRAIYQVVVYTNRQTQVLPNDGTPIHHRQLFANATHRQHERCRRRRGDAPACP